MAITSAPRASAGRSRKPVHFTNGVNRLASVLRVCSSSYADFQGLTPPGDYSRATAAFELDLTAAVGGDHQPGAIDVTLSYDSAMLADACAGVTTGA